MKSMFFSSAAVCIGVAGAARGASLVFVDAHLTTGLDNGTSWANAFQGRLGLKHALDSLDSAGAEVWVADGVYAPGGPADAPTASFIIPSGTAVLGGFAANETDEAQRLPAVNIAVLSGDLHQDDGDTVFDHTGDNSWHVVRCSSAAAGTIIDGFTIRDGFAETGNEAIDLRGAGMLIDGGEPTVRRCVFLDARANEGAGIAVVGGGAPLIEDCTFTLNNSAEQGAGVHLDQGCDAHLRSCSFIENYGREGVGVYSTFASPVIEDCLFERNIAINGAPAGGGLYVIGGSPIVKGCRFIQNQSQGGGGIELFASNIVISRCEFIGNVGTGDGGDALVIIGSAAQVNSCVFIGTGDTASLDPSGIFAVVGGAGGPVEFTNCSFANNGAAAGSAGPFSGHSVVSCSTSMPVVFENCIIWGNASLFGNGIQAVVGPFSTPPVFNRCIVQGWDGSFPGTGTSGSNPGFADADGADNVRGNLDDDLHLGAGSVAIDAGWNGSLPTGETLDVEGLSRFRDDPASPDSGVGSAPLVDLGAHEFQPSTCTGDANGDGSVNFGDITFIFAQWGNPFDFGAITQTLAAWGGC